MSHRERFGGQVVIGVALICAGGALFLEKEGIISIGPIWQYWPLILIGLGIVKTMQAQSRKEQGMGIWLLFIGLWFEVSLLNLWGLTFSETWPVILIAFGISMLWKGLPRINSNNPEKEKNNGD